MMFRRAIRDAILAFALALNFSAAPAAARGDLGVDHDACVLKIGPDLIYFTGYQPGASRRKFCEDAPDVGKTIFVFDYAEPELREMKADFRILQPGPDGQEPDDLEAATLAYLPPNVYPKGTFSFEYVFARAGDYIGVVTVDGPQGERWVARFPFSVATTHIDRTPLYLIAAAAALGLLLLLSKDGGRGLRFARGPRSRG